MTSAVVPAPGDVPPADGHRWVELLDDHGDRWLFDATFLLSTYHCIYGAGCPGIEEEPDPTGSLGCCVHGAHMVDAEDRADVEAAAARLDADTWQFAARARRKGGPLRRKKDGSWVTRKADGACIFLNREGFAGGAGCALHRLALDVGERPVDLKPDVCWQVPVRLDVHTDDYGADTVFLRGWQRADWGPGGADFHWWCLEEPEAHTAADPVYVGMRDELELLVGEELYTRLVDHLEEIRLAAELRSQEVMVSLGTRTDLAEDRR